MRFRKPARDAIQLGQHSIPIDKLFEHLSVAGNPGTGKSTLIRQILRQVHDRDLPAVIIDVEGESTMEFYDESRGDVILNPLDARCPFWSPWLELRPGTEPMDATALAASIVRGLPRDDTQRYFRDNARALVRAMFEVIEDRDDLTSFATFLAQPREQIRAQLDKTSAAAVIDPGAHDSGGGQAIISVANTALEGFAHLPRRDQAQRTWSAREWAHNRKGWIFLPATEDARAAIESLQGVWLDSLVRWLLAGQIGSNQVFLYCDELPAMGYQPNVATVLARGRKREISCTIGFQSISQLRSIYGHDGATTLTSCPTTQIFLRTPEPETAKWASDSIGSHEVDRIGISQLTGLSNYREGLTLNPHRTVEPLVLPGEIQGLEPFEGYICCGRARTTIRIPRIHLIRRNADFIPRLNAAPQPATSQKPEGPSDEQIVAELKARATRSPQQATGE
jgi:type IV secretory pathway TraG/TraD family ATPase VirD4